jgi:predicted transcriptional regulator
MLTVRDIMTADPVTVSAQATLRTAVELLAAHGISGMPVLSGDDVVGTLSAGNIISFEATTPGVPTERIADDVWYDDVPTIDDDGSSPGLSYFAELYEDAGADVVERFRAADTPEWDVLSEHTVEEAMSRELLALAPSASADQAAEYMRATGVHRVLVVEGTRLLGIVTTMDITRAFAEHRE